MKKVLAVAVAILMLDECNAFATLAATTVWEFRVTATASMVNGGGFNSANASPGTDFSQQNAAQATGANLASSNGTTNPCVVSSASHNFTSTDHGNIIHITAGTSWITGWYEIVSTSGNAATLDRACGSSASISGGTWYLGGALSLNSTLDDDFFEQLTPGNVVWFKAGDYSAGEGILLSTFDGTIQDNLYIIGYNTTRGDAPTGDNRPSITWGTAYYQGGDYINISNMRWLESTATTLLTLGTGGSVHNTRLQNTSSTASRNALNLYSYTLAIGNDISSDNGRALYSGNYVNQIILGNYIHDSPIGLGSGHGAYSGNSIINNIFKNVATCFDFVTAGASKLDIFGNTFYGAETPSGTCLDLAGTAYVRVYNNIFYGWTTAITATTQNDTYFGDYNDFYNNTTNRTNFPTGPHDLALDPGFTNAASGDFSIGTNLKAAGFPGAFPGTTSTGYLDIGAVQRQESGGGVPVPKGWTYVN